MIFVYSPGILWYYIKANVCRHHKRARGPADARCLGKPLPIWQKQEKSLMRRRR